MEPKVEWIEVDLSMNKKDLPNPLCYQSGGLFWVTMDGGIHGKSVSLAPWTGERFMQVNNSIVTHFAKSTLPKPA